MTLDKKDKVELGVGVLIICVYIISQTSLLNIEATGLLHAMVIASAIAIFGDNFLQARKKT